jgi:hypothetical protein
MYGGKLNFCNARSYRQYVDPHVKLLYLVISIVNSGIRILARTSKLLHGTKRASLKEDIDNKRKWQAQCSRTLVSATGHHSHVMQAIIATFDSTPTLSIYCFPLHSTSSPIILASLRVKDYRLPFNSFVHPFLTFPFLMYANYSFLCI